MADAEGDGFGRLLSGVILRMGMILRMGAGRRVLVPGGFSFLAFLPLVV